MKEIMRNDWSSLKLMSPYILCGVGIALSFVFIQMIINKIADSEDNTCEKEK